MIFIGIVELVIFIRARVEENKLFISRQQIQLCEKT